MVSRFGNTRLAGATGSSGPKQCSQMAEGPAGAGRWQRRQARGQGVRWVAGEVAARPVSEIAAVGSWVVLMATVASTWSWSSEVPRRVSGRATVQNNRSVGRAGLDEAAALVPENTKPAEVRGLAF